MNNNQERKRMDQFNHIYNKTNKRDEKNELFREYLTNIIGLNAHGIWTKRGF